MRTYKLPALRLARLFLLVAVGAFAFACNGPDVTDSNRLTQIQELEDENASLRRQLVAKDEAIGDQAQRIQALQGLQGERSVDSLIHVSNIEVHTLSGGYDDDHDGVDECVKVYLRLLDQDGEAIKAAGTVHIRLLDLANPPTSQLVGEVRLTADEMRPLWFGRFLTAHYTIRVPWADGAERAEHKSITVVARFTDLLTGQSFSTQAVVEVNGAGSAQSGIQPKGGQASGLKASSPRS